MKREFRNLKLKNIKRILMNFKVEENGKQTFESKNLDLIIRQINTSLTPAEKWVFLKNAVDTNLSNVQISLTQRVRLENGDKFS